MPVYRRGGSGVKVTVGVGVKNTGAFNLLRPKRGPGGRFEAGTEPVYPEAWRWGSVKRYTMQANSGGLRDFATQLDRWLSHVKGNAHKVGEFALTPAFELSMVYCPKDTGDLVSTARLEATAAGAGGSASVSITYGGNGFPWYAVFVHEILTYRHEAPTRAKFLETALNETMGTIESRIEQGARLISGEGG